MNNKCRTCHHTEKLHTKRAKACAGKNCHCPCFRNTKAHYAHKFLKGKVI